MTSWRGRWDKAASVRQAGFWTALFGALVVFGLAAGAYAQGIPGLSVAEEEEAVPEVDPLAEPAVEERFAEVRDQRAAIDRELAGAKEEQARHLEEISQELAQIGALLEQQVALLGRVEAPGREDLPDAEPSLFALHDLYEARFASQTAAEEFGTRVDLAREALESAKERLEAASAARRDAAVELERAEDPGRLVAERRLERRELAERLAQETVHLRTLETRAALAASKGAADTDALDERIEAMRAALARGEGNSRAGLAALVEREGDLRRRREAAARRLSSADLRLQAAQNRFAREARPTQEMLAEVEALTASRDAFTQEIAILDSRLERIGTEREVSKQWATLLSGEPAREDLDAWEAAARERIEALEHLGLEREGRLAHVSSRLEALEDSLADASEAPGLRRVREEQVGALRHLENQLRTEARSLAVHQRLNERLLDDVRDRTGHLDPLEYLAHGAQAVSDIWTYEITTVDDAPITVGSVVLALFLFGAGLWAARRGSSFVAKISEERFKLDAGAAHALQTLSFYMLMVGFALLALRAVHFPLTAFTVLGGALAIGIGFGSQNVMNNFISGLILMLERPVRARDVVEVDGNHGTIENIGARSTQIRSTDGRHMVVPNSFFLESNVVNWTLSDDLIRVKVTVGVIYGSPTRLVEKLIKRVVDENDAVLKEPAPIIIFEEFGDNSLNFDVYFWVKARSPMQARLVQSRVRFSIDDLFREHDLVIAFPQRDVHLDSVTPIEVRVLNGRGDPASPVEQ